MLSREEIQAARDANKCPPAKDPSTSSTRTFDLRGAPKVVTTDLYLENMSIPVGAINRDIAASITKHAAKYDIRIMRAMVRRNKFVNDQVSCRITVPSTQVAQCKSVGIWPTHVTCRDWKPRSEMPDRRGWGYGSKNQEHYKSTWGGNKRYDHEYDRDYDRDYNRYRDTYNSDRWDNEQSSEWS